MDEHDMTTIDSRIKSYETTALPPINMLLSVNRPFLSPQLDLSQSKLSDYYNKSVSELKRTHYTSTTKDDHTSHSLKDLGQQLHQIASLNNQSISPDQVESSHTKNAILLPQHEYRKQSDEKGSEKDVSASLPVSNHPTEYDFNEIIKQCSTIEKEMKEKIKAELDDSVSMEPWLDGMITAANKILNALLRLRKRQMTMESSIHKQHMESQYDEKNIEIPKTRKRRAVVIPVISQRHQNGEEVQMEHVRCVTRAAYVSD
ncbi:hypothetical protein RO3G_01382 [Rhizopus delemar RA 99-880]|uniref:Uncharacterized protein n=1 Tax=Rhizopus delemar (strain RA 99-880 / ATCC MYA-4621 / FGSC 9543 / NRRL 43880) TaxID=246409 RepID=I1BKE8_RHIO9|nr:hypothetical protein RO3G_01382 [Rhizopus delemar RA 99-880]|eukprot:EIE76678.1 hypothetical protein RO3G_01382 [Rhizopus delemar RA 99-880]